MFKKLICASIHTTDILKSLSFYEKMGLKENWRIDRVIDDGSEWTLIGMKFPSKNSSDLVLSNHPYNTFTEIEIQVEDIDDAYIELSKDENIKWIREPFKTESNKIAVMKAPDGNVFVLISELD
jgi:catechol 2,3-dioxygenase-like lactoylglutathione lyase family enzyme